MRRAIQQPLKSAIDYTEKNKDKYSFVSLTSMEKSIRSSFKYFGDEDKGWWENSFAIMQDVTKSLNNISLEVAFCWPGSQVHPLVEADQGIAKGSVFCSTKVNKEPEDHVMYLGNRRALKKKQGQTPEKLADLSKGMLIAVPSTDDDEERPFWIARVKDIVHKDNLPSVVKVHWYATKDTDPFVGRYDPVIIPFKKGRKTMNKNRMDNLDLNETQVLAYDFTLKVDNLLHNPLDGALGPHHIGI